MGSWPRTLEQRKPPRNELSSRIRTPLSCWSTRTWNDKGDPISTHEEWQQWIESHRLELESAGTPFELKFAETVLSKVKGLDPTVVYTQTHFKDLKGRPRRIDFSIQEGDFVRIGIEVDGWDKKNRGSGMSRGEFRDWSLRELSMAAAGWTPLRFANSLVTHDPDDCRELIEIRLGLERERARTLLGGGVRGEEEHRAVQRVRNSARDAERRLEGGTDPSTVESIRTEFDQASRKDLAALTSQLDPETKKRMTVLEKERRDTLAVLEREIAKRVRAEKENRGMKIMGVAVILMAVVAIMAVVAVLALSGVFETNPNDGADPGGPRISMSDPRKCNLATPASKISRSEIGSTVIVRGEVADTRAADGSVPAYLNLGRPNPREDLEIIVWSDQVENFVPPPEDAYNGRDIAVSGELDEFEGSLQVEAQTPSDIVYCD